MNVHPMWDDYPALRDELEATLSLIEQHITINHLEVRTKINQLLSGGGKLLRPAYSLMFSQFSKNHDPEKARAVAAAIEVLHMATLVHDDVIDESAVRRGKETINAAYDNRVAVYTGDYLFTVCFGILKHYAQDAAILDLDTRGMETILIGELNQMTNRYATDMKMRDYLRQIKGKTAHLFALSCYSGAYHTEADKKIANQAYQIGNNIGMAFQITDDILDYSRDGQKIGKPVLQDFRNGIYTAPVLFALQSQRKVLMPYLLKKDQVTDEDMSKVWEIVVQAGGVDKAEKLADKYSQKALKQIKNLPDGEEKKAISSITEQTILRER